MLMNNNFAGYKIKDLTKWEYFKSVDITIQKSFIMELKNEFNANTNVLADMFNINYTVLDMILKRILLSHLKDYLEMM